VYDWIYRGDEIIKLYNCYFGVAVSEDSLGLKLLQPPASLQSDTLQKRGWCRTVNIMADGKIMCRRNEALEVINRTTFNTIYTVDDTTTTVWTETIQPEGVVVGSCYNVEDNTAEVTLLDQNTFEKSRTIYRHLISIPTFYRIAQHLSLVYILDYREKRLVVVNLVDDTTQKFEVFEMEDPRPLCILPDSTVLIGDRSLDGAVSRYKVENTTLTKLWEFPGIPKPTGISFDPTSELIHICTALGPLLILSLEGKHFICLALHLHASSHANIFFIHLMEIVALKISFTLCTAWKWVLRLNQIKLFASKEKISDCGS